MTRRRRIRIPRKSDFITWFYQRFGRDEMMIPAGYYETMLKLLKNILQECNGFDLYILAQIMLQLSKSPQLKNRILHELEYYY